jgi:hypothetical protein
MKQAESFPKESFPKELFVHTRPILPKDGGQKGDVYLDVEEVNLDEVEDGELVARYRLVDVKVKRVHVQHTLEDQK